MADTTLEMTSEDPPSRKRYSTLTAGSNRDFKNTPPVFRNSHSDYPDARSFIDHVRPRG